MTDDVAALGVGGLARALAARELSATEAATYYLGRIEALDALINAFIEVTSELAMAAAQASDERRERGRARGPLDGIPIALKDNIDVKGIATTAGIGARRHEIARESAAVTAKLEQAGAVIVGKLNMHEAAFGATNDNPHFGACHNPRKRGRIPGGSSGGSAAAVAAGLAAATLGTDTLGSIRIPAHCCGVTGHKPTQGLVSTRGVVPLSYTLDTVGPLAQSPEDAALVMAGIAGFDPRSAESRAPSAALKFDTAPLETLRGLTFGIPSLEGIPLTGDVGRLFEEAKGTLKSLGATLKALPPAAIDFDGLFRAGVIVSAVEGGTALGPDRRDLSPETALIFDTYGVRGTPEEFEVARRKLASAIVEARLLFADVDLLVLPTVPATARPIGEGNPAGVALLTSFVNAMRAPATSVPMGVDAEGLPAGLQIVGPEFADSLVLRVAGTYARAVAPFALAY